MTDALSVLLIWGLESAIFTHEIKKNRVKMTSGYNKPEN